MRIYMMERFLERIAVSAYKDSFIIKGGILVTSLVGISMRSTMDIDTSIKGQKLSLENAKNIINEIIEIKLEDGVSFAVKNAETIMDEMEYPGIRFHIDVLFEKMVTPIKIDISTGDVITPSAIEYHYTLILEDRKIDLWSYNLETILAEKLQTILVRERANTRMRDFYDIYVLLEKYNAVINTDIFKKAYEATCRKRESLHLFGHEIKILEIISNDNVINSRWSNYQGKFSFAKETSFDETVACIKILISLISNNQ